MIRNLATAALASLIFGGIVGTGVGFNHSRTTEAAIIADLERDTLLAADTVELLIRNLRLAVTTVASNIDPDDISGSAEVFWPTVQGEWLDFRTVLVIDPTGVIVADLRRDGAAVGTNVAFRGYFSEVMSGRSPLYFVGSPIVSTFDGQWVLPVSAPIRDADQIVRGVVTASVQAEYFNPVDWQTLGAETNVHLIGMDTGEVFALQPEDLLIEPNETIDRDMLAGISVENDHTLGRIPVAGQTAFLSGTNYASLGVIASRRTDDIHNEAVTEGRVVGALTAAIAAFLMIIFLRGRVVLQWVRADAARLRVLQERQRLATSSGGIGVWDLEISTGKLVWDSLMHQHYGTDPETFGDSSENWAQLVHPDDLDRVLDRFKDSVRTGKDFIEEFRIRTPNGEERTLRSHASIGKGPNGRSEHMIGVNYDVTREISRENALKSALAQIEKDASHDALTGIGNRRGFYNHVDALGKSNDPDMPIAILLLDIDHYKLINDVMGHTGGDHLLQVLAAKMTALVGPDGYVARIGGDEFALILSGPEIADHALEMSDRILELCREPVPFKDKTIRYSVSIGLAIGPVSSAHRLLEDADIALYDAKNAGRNQFQVFTAEMRLRSQEKKTLADELNVAIEQGQIGIRLQPQICTRTGKLAGAEVLMRWWHPVRGEMTPPEFLHIATDVGLMNDLDTVVLGKAMEAADALARQGIVLPSLSLNISIDRLISPGLMDDVVALPKHGGELIFELLEVTDFSCTNKEILDRIKALRDLGIKFAVDDFGSGHASLTTLLELNPDYVKIDKRLVIEGTADGKGPSAFLITISELCSRLKIAIIAEGVETPQAVDMMVGLGADFLQGYFYAHPLTTDEFVAWTRSDAVTRGPYLPRALRTAGA
ncbi:bifunctional diguanylate cyclase/phosphodiesterase [Roseicyclus marinus]|uniref:bifunctional diguanylate cyclase/phosphodiesterase n=1 Tax=Roseicyclus marinus TaxID=2161673 RepID=UPI00240FC5FB|nr:EAL domain-containing protein [Roseicyclus marinus]MDG3041769.1 EAL domain-containing protein [Roseicyclus marinus]